MPVQNPLVSSIIGLATAVGSAIVAFGLLNGQTVQILVTLIGTVIGAVFPLVNSYHHRTVSK